MPLWFRALFVTLLFPGTVAGFVPYRLAAGRYALPLPPGLFRWSGMALLLGGLALLLLTIWDFARSGHGTLAPWDAPTALVDRRLYARVRNPMYLGVLACIVGQGLWRGSGGVLLYGGLMAVVLHLRVVRFEEPALQRQFGAPYAEYLKRVSRWVPRWW